MRSDRLFSRDFTLMILGQIISLFGNAILRFALSLYVLDTTGSAAAFGGILAVSMVPTILCSPLGGVLADRVPRQRIMWGLDFFTAATSKWPVCLPVPKRYRDKAAACLARVHGEELLDRPMGALSGGQLQRVLLALALEPVPHILILDEPLSGVDIEGEHQLLEMLDELRTQYDLSIFLSTHDFATLEQYADKVILLNKQVLKAGAPEEVLASPEFYETFHLKMGKGGGQK